MRLRISATQRKHLAELRRAMRAGAGNERLGGMLVVPRMASSIEEWEEEAQLQQAQLIAEARDDPRHAVVAEPEPMTAAQERKFTHTMETTRKQRAPLTEEQRAALAFARATGSYR